MKKTVFLALALFILLGAAAGCGGPAANLAGIDYPQSAAFDDYETRRTIEQENKVDDAIIDSVNRFSFESAAAVLGSEEGNACYCPISLYMALALASTGAEGETKMEMMTLLGEEDTEYLSRQMGMLYRRLYVNNDVSKLYMTNSLWMNEGLKFKQEFVKNAKENFYAAANNLDFSDEGAGETISRWISDNTEGLLEPEIKVDPLYLMYIVNTIYLNDEWSSKFNEDATQEDVFHMADGSTVDAQFMNRTFDTGVVKTEDYTAVRLNMKETGRMIFVLPDEEMDAVSLLGSSDVLEFVTDTDNSEYGRVELSLPKFGFDSDFKLKESLKSLGMVTAFDDQSADFSGISDVPSFIGGVKQGSRIEIDENGVEAAAYTIIDFAASAEMPDEPIVLNFNRPFIFIVQSDAGLPLFIGIVQNPAE